MCQTPPEEHCLSAFLEGRPLAELVGVNIITLSASEQLAFWTALWQPPELTPAQEKLGRLMRGKL